MNTVPFCNTNAEKLNLPFQNEEFDVIWSDGAIANIGLEKGGLNGMKQ